MRKVIIGFSTPKSWMPYSWLIQTAYGTPFSHVYVRFRSDKFDRDLIYQASKSIVNFMGMDVFLGHNQIVEEYEVDISEEKFNEMIAFAIDTAGKPYGVLQAVGMGLVRIAEIFGKTIKNPFKDGGATYVCSEMGAYVLANFDSITLPKDADDMTPKDVRDCLTALALQGLAKLASAPNSQASDSDSK